MKHCVSCKFYDPPAFGFGDDCGRHRRYVSMVDPVTGNDRQENVGGLGVRPAEERSSWLPWRCGPKGRYFQPKGTA